MEECDICGRKCDGVHSIKTNNKEKEIQKMVKTIESYGEKMVDEIIQQIYENRRLMSGDDTILVLGCIATERKESQRSKLTSAD